MPRKKIKLGDVLLEQGVISEKELDYALAEQTKIGHKLGRILIELEFITEDRLLQILAEQLELPLIDLKQYVITAETVQLLPETYARRFRAIVIDATAESVTIGMSDPNDIFAYDELSRILKKSVSLAVVRESELLSNLDIFYRKSDELANIAGEMGAEILEKGDFDLESIMQSATAPDAPVVKLLQNLFEDASNRNASDIHIEPDADVLRIRQRIDGILHEQIITEIQIIPALVSRLKLMGGIDISERRRPQDGRFQMKIKDKQIDVRVSTMPIQFGEQTGESVVLRLLDQSGQMLELEKLGMPVKIRERFRLQIHRPNGIVLITGPTGSGKTTTLYAALNELNQPEKKIITVEDPVEYQLPRINQVQVNSKIGLTFSTVLRNTLRQDPDIIMVGEMRDQETIEIGLRAALTGHFVLSSLHTNDAVSTALRLLNMGAEGYELAGALRAIIAQRLIRRVCKGCVTKQLLDAQQRSWLRALVGVQSEQLKFVSGGGCTLCHGTGYHGRVGIYEFLELDDKMARALQQNNSIEFCNMARIHPHFRSLTLNALDCAIAGVTTLDEVQRVASEILEDDTVLTQNNASTTSEDAESTTEDITTTDTIPV